MARRLSGVNRSSSILPSRSGGTSNSMNRGELAFILRSWLRALRSSKLFCHWRTRGGVWRSSPSSTLTATDSGMLMSMVGVTGRCPGVSPSVDSSCSSARRASVEGGAVYPSAHATRGTSKHCISLEACDQYLSLPVQATLKSLEIGPLHMVVVSTGWTSGPPFCR